VHAFGARAAAQRGATRRCVGGGSDDCPQVASPAAVGDAAAGRPPRLGGVGAADVGGWGAPGITQRTRSVTGAARTGVNVPPIEVEEPLPVFATPWCPLSGVRHPPSRRAPPRYPGGSPLHWRRPASPWRPSLSPPPPQVVSRPCSHWPPPPPTVPAAVTRGRVSPPNQFQRLPRSGMALWCDAARGKAPYGGDKSHPWGEAHAFGRRRGLVAGGGRIASPVAVKGRPHASPYGCP